MNLKHVTDIAWKDHANGPSKKAIELTFEDGSKKFLPRGSHLEKELSAIFGLDGKKLVDEVKGVLLRLRYAGEDLSVDVTGDPRQPEGWVLEPPRTMLMEDLQSAKCPRPLRCLGCSTTIPKGEEAFLDREKKIAVGCSRCLPTFSEAENAEIEGDAEPDLELGSDAEIAGLLIEILTERAGGVRPVYSGGLVYVYDPAAGYWQATEDSVIRSLAVQEYDGATYPGNDGIATVRMSKSKADSIMDLVITRLQAERIEEDGRGVDFFDRAKKGLAFENGFLEMREDGTTVLISHAPENRATHGVDYCYDADAPRDEWIKALKEVWANVPDVEERIACWQEAVGLALFGYGTKYNTCLLFTGSGSTGRSTIVETVAESIFPAETVSTVSPNKWGDEKYLAALKGARLNMIVEQSADAFQTEIFKAVVDGGQVTARQVYERAFQFKPIALHVLCPQESPASRDMSHGFFRRWILIDFPNTFDHKSTNKEDVKDRIKRQASGIMAWAIEGCSRALGEGKLTRPSSAVGLLDQWKATADSVALFLQDCCVTGEPYEAERRNLYQAYVEYCVATGHAKMAQNKFSGKLEQLGHRFNGGEKKNLRRYRVGVKDRKEWDCRPRTSEEEEKLPRYSLHSAIPSGPIAVFSSAKDPPS